jgi:hypothetical protein
MSLSVETPVGPAKPPSDTSEVSTLYLHIVPRCVSAASQLASLHIPGLVRHSLSSGHVAFSDRPSRTSFDGIGVFGDRLCRSGDAAPPGTGRGNYMIVRVSGDETRLVADPLGTYPIFYFDGPEFFAASNEIFRLHEALAQLGAECPRSSLLYAGFITLGCAPGGITGFEGIRMLPVGAEIVFRADGSAGIVRRPLADLLYSGANFEELLQRADDEIRSNVRAIANGGFEDLSCDLTGGMDSPLVVAAVLAERLGDAFSIVTRGDQRTPDAQVAAMIRERFGLRRSGGGSSVGPQEPLSGLQRALARTQGMMELPFVFASAPGSMRLTGGLGELMRTFWSNPPDGPPLGRLLENLARAGTNYISPFAARRLRRAIAEDGTAILGEGVASEDLGDAFYLTTRNRYHFGVPWRGSGAQFHPLYAPAAIAAAHKLRREHRRINTVGHALMSRWSRDLAAMPFADKAWHPSLTEPTPPVKSSPSPFGPIASRGGGRWRTTKRAFDQRFPSPDLTVLAPHFWTSGVRDLMSRKSRLSKPEMVRASRTICAYLWMGGHEVEQTREADIL